MLSNRIKDKLKLSCHKNPIQNVVIDWFLNGSVDEKNDANNIIFNAEESLKIVNGLNHQLNPNFKVKHFYKKLNSMVYSLLTKNDDYSNLSTRNRKNIEIRGWLLTVYTTTITENAEASLQLIKNYLNGECDRKVTMYWALVAILYFYKKFTQEDKLQFVNEYFGRIAIDSKNPQVQDRIYWLLKIWYINNNYDDENNTHLNNIKSLLSKKEKDRTHFEDVSVTELFAALSFRPCLPIIKDLQKFIDDVIEKDLEDFWEEKDIHMYKYLILTLRQYGEKEFKKSIGDEQVNIFYKIFKLLTVSRSYSSRIWNEIKLQLLKSLRIYNRTTKKRIVDELKEELLDTDLSIVFEACKTLKSIFEIETCLKIIIEVLYNESIKNISSAEKKIYAISYSLKIISIKETNLVHLLQEQEQRMDDYNKKNIVRKLFTEMGGMQAIKKSQQNNDIREKYMNMTCKAQEKVENMFHRSIYDAKRAFRTSLIMNVIVFAVGIILLLTSGLIAITNDTQDKWAGVGVSSGTGFLSLVYSLFINKPSRKIRKNTNHLMRLKVIFLGYLRELTQMDQSFSKNLLDSDIISQSMIHSFVSQIKLSMNNALVALRWEEILNNKLTTTQMKELVIDNNNNPTTEHLGLSPNSIINNPNNLLETDIQNQKVKFGMETSDSVASSSVSNSERASCVDPDENSYFTSRRSFYYKKNGKTSPVQHLQPFNTIKTELKNMNMAIDDKNKNKNIVQLKDLTLDNSPKTRVIEPVLNEIVVANESDVTSTLGSNKTNILVIDNSDNSNNSNSDESKTSIV